MNLLADSGSTKTEWVLFDKSSKSMVFRTMGLNPYHNTDLQIHDELVQFKNSFENESFDNIYFYGSGCSGVQVERMTAIFRKIFDNSKIVIESDILGASRALFGQNQGIASILGTGSNSVIYSDGKIQRGIESMGYLLGDEGSGSVLGRQILLAWLRGKFDDKLTEHFNEKYKITPAIIRENLYQKPFVNRFLASFSIFASDNMHDKAIRKILLKHFNSYFKYQLLKLNESNNYKIGIVGSIGFYFQEIILEIASIYNLDINKIIQSPIDDLIRFHQNEL